MKSRTGTIAALVAVLALGLWLVCGRRAAQEVVYPLENGRAWVARTLFTRLKGVFRQGAVAAENRRLKLENEALHLLEIDIAKLRTENARLRGLLDFKSDSPSNRWICAPVLSRDGAGGVRGLLRVGRGSADGVTTNAAVVVADGLVGRVERVTSRTADGRLITSPSVKVSCEIATGDPEFGTVYGILEGGGTHLIHAEAGASVLYLINPLRIRHLKRRPNLPSRAKIITSGLGGIYPRGLTIGYLIDGCDEDDSLLEREGDVEPAVDFPALEDVFIRRAD